MNPKHFHDHAGQPEAEWTCSECGAVYQAENVSLPEGETKDFFVCPGCHARGTYLEVSKAATLLGRKGGRAKSAAKAEAARENGKKGGRPLSPYAVAYDIMRGWDREAGIRPRCNRDLDLDVPGGIESDWEDFLERLQEDDEAAIIEGRSAWRLPLF